MKMILNGALFYIGWFIAVGGAIAGNGWIGPLAIGAMVLVHMIWLAEGNEFLLVLKVTLAGTVIETFNLNSSLYLYETPLSVPIAPPWIISLYTLFAISLNGSLKWLREHPGMSSLLGAVSGSFSYCIGVRMGALHFGLSPWVVLPVSTMIWGVMTPVYYRWARQCLPKQ